MREYVVHLAGHLRPFEGPRLGDPAALLGLGPLRPLPERGEELLPGLDPLTPAEQCGVDGEVEYGEPQEREIADRPQQTLDEVRRGLEQGDGAAVRNGNRRATVSVAAVDGGVAAGETAASTASAIAVGIGRRPTQHQPAGDDPDHDVQCEPLVLGGSDIRPTIVSADSTPIATTPNLGRQIAPHRRQLSMPPTLGRARSVTTDQSRCLADFGPPHRSLRPMPPTLTPDCASQHRPRRHSDTTA